MCFKIEWRFYGYTKKSSSKQKKKKSYINVYSRTNTIFPIPSFLCLHWNWIFHFLFEIIMEYYVILKSLNIGIWKVRELTIHWNIKKLYFLFIYSKIISLHFYRQFSLNHKYFSIFFIIYIQKTIYNSPYRTHTQTHTHILHITSWCSLMFENLLNDAQTSKLKHYSYSYITNHEIKKKEQQ